MARLAFSDKSVLVCRRRIAERGGESHALFASPRESSVQWTKTIGTDNKDLRRNPENDWYNGAGLTLVSNKPLSSSDSLGCRRRLARPLTFPSAREWAHLVVEPTQPSFAGTYLVP